MFVDCTAGAGEWHGRRRSETFADAALSVLRRRTGCTAPNLSEQENQRLYGKCNNPYGHGHNYVVEVTVTGPVDPATGMIANLGDLDPFVEREVIERVRPEDT